MGIAPKYMYFEMNLERPTENTIVYKTKSIRQENHQKDMNLCSPTMAY